MTETLSNAINEAIRAANSRAVTAMYYLEIRETSLGNNALTMVGKYNPSYDSNCTAKGDLVIDDGTKNTRVFLVKLAGDIVGALGSEIPDDNYDIFAIMRDKVAAQLGKALMETPELEEKE